MKQLLLFKKKIARRIYVLAFCIFITIVSTAQTSNISGIVNNYYKVVEIIPSKACIRVENISGLSVNKMVMLVQMKGASVNTSNSVSFGDTLSLNNAGNYEIGTVCYIIGDSVFLFHNLLNFYTPSTEKVQLVEFAEYISANVVDTVKAAKWDSAAGTGGVIALFATQNISLNAPVYADSSGYLGGNYVISNGTCNNFLPASNYIYNATNTAPQNGAYKGESVTNLTASQTGGRGAPANGGGGGNNHNNSGGGGANLNNGGIGGGNSSVSPSCYVTNAGLAGKALSSWSGQKIFMGGGGGAGHTNNVLSLVSGGNGGGLIFIWAENLIGNGYDISASGGSGGPSLSDGAGGGGAGGTIIMNVANYTGSVNIKTSGGKGGDSNNDVTPDRCYGGGGGGSGGAIYYKNSLPSVTSLVVGGAGGIEIGRHPTCATAVSAVAGSNGQIVTDYTFSRSMNPAGYCRLLLPIKLVSFNASVIEKKILLEWQIENSNSIKYFIIERSVTGNQWKQLQSVPGIDQVNIYSFFDENPFPGENFYRLKFIEKDNSVSYSVIKKVLFRETNEFHIYPNPANNKLFITGINDSPVDISCIGLSGKILFQKNKITLPSSIELPYLPDGIYLLKINNTYQKLVITK